MAASRNRAWVRITLWIVFVTAPSTLLTGYAVYKLREFAAVHWRAQISHTTYQFVLLVAMMVAFWISAGKPLKEIKRICKRQDANIE